MFGGRRQIMVTVAATGYLLWLGAEASAGAAGAGQPHRTIEVSSGRCPGLDLPSARQQAEEKVQEKLLTAVGRLAEELSGRKLSATALAGERAWLLEQPGVQCQRQVHEETKEYGPVAEATLSVAVPQAVLAQWAKRLAQRHREHDARLVGGVLATAGLWLAGLVLWVKLDRATGGYYRTMLGVAIVAGLVLASVAGWTWFFSGPMDSGGPWFSGSE